MALRQRDIIVPRFRSMPMDTDFLFTVESAPSVCAFTCVDASIPVYDIARGLNPQPIRLVVGDLRSRCSGVRVQRWVKQKSSWNKEISTLCESTTVSASARFITGSIYGYGEEKILTVTNDVTFTSSDQIGKRFWWLHLYTDRQDFTREIARNCGCGGYSRWSDFGIPHHRSWRSSDYSQHNIC